MTPNKLPPLPKHAHAFQDPEGDQPDILVYSADQMHAYALEALRQSQSLPAGAVAGLVGKWRDEASAMFERMKEKEPDGITYRFAEWYRGEERARAGVRLACAEALENSLQADAREKGEAVPQRLLTELYGLAQGDLPDGDGVSVSVAMWANNWLYELTQPAQASGASGPTFYVGRVYDCDAGEDRGEIHPTLPANLIGKRVRLVPVDDSDIASSGQEKE